VMPNIVEFGAKALKGTVPFETVTLNSIIVIFLGGIIFIAIAGFLVTYIFGAKNMKDAFYKGIAVPTLIISLANGMTATRTNVASIPTTPLGDHALYVPAISERSTPLIPFFINKAHAENGQAVGRGTVEFRISPSDLTRTSRNQKG